MKKMQSFALYALVTPVMALGAGSVLAQQPTAEDAEREQQRIQHDQDAMQSSPKTAKDPQSASYAKQSGSQAAADRRNMGDESRKQKRGYLDSAPANGIQASNLIGAEVKTTGDEEVGPVDDLIIDENGQVLAIVIGAGGFLGMGEKDVAIGWDDVTRSGTSDELELRIDVTRDELGSAPEFEKRD